MYSSRSISLPQYGSTVRPNSLVPTFEGFFRRAIASVQDFAENASSRMEKIKGDCKAVGMAIALIGAPLLLTALWQMDSPRPTMGTNPIIATQSF